jgi:hypothetical protein
MDAGVGLPASFTIVPRADGPRDEWVTFALRASTEGSTPIAVRRIVHTRFEPRRNLVQRIFLSASCSRPDTRCRAHTPCTVQDFCEENNQTCGDLGECVSLVTCPVGQSLCNDRCIDTEGDDRNCGACGRTCAAGQRCCAGRCVDPQADNAHCGRCGSVCAGGQSCQGGRVRVPAGPGGVRRRVRGDPARPGELRRLRQPLRRGPGLDGGIVCPTGLRNCAGTCVSTSTDARNCGACGNACATGQRCCGGTCVNLSRNESNCGACGNRCGSAQLCCAGVCRNVSMCP